MVSRFLFLALILIWGLNPAYARWVSFSNPGFRLAAQREEPAQVLFDDQGKSVSVELSGINIETVKIKRWNHQESEFATLSLPEGSSTLTEGFPKLPVIRTMIEVPHRNVRVEVQILQQREYSLAELGSNHPVFPFQESVEKVEGADDRKQFALNADAYRLNVFYPESIAASAGSSVLR